MIAINERGEVAAARVIKSDDARIDPLAIARILQWKFAPAENAEGPAKSLAKLPLIFVGPLPAGRNAIHFNIGPFGYGGSYPSIRAPVQMTGEALRGVKAARLVITSAVDDTGAELAYGSTGDFFRTAVGSTSSDPLGNRLARSEHPAEAACGGRDAAALAAWPRTNWSCPSSMPIPRSRSTSCPAQPS